MHHRLPVFHYLFLGKEHALFVGYAPIVNPKFAVVTLVEHGKSGSKVAAPIAKEALLMAQELL